MKMIKIDAGTYQRLEWLAANYFVVKGADSMPLKELITRLIDHKYDEANLHEYQTTGFGRQ